MSLITCICLILGFHYGSYGFYKHKISISVITDIAHKGLTNESSISINSLYLSGYCQDELPTDYKCPKGCPTLAKLGYCEDHWDVNGKIRLLNKCSIARGTVKDFCKKSCINCGIYISRPKDLSLTSSITYVLLSDN